MAVAAGAAAAEKPAARSPVATTQHSPDEFGTQDYAVTTIGYGSFTPASNDNSSYPPYTDFGFSRRNTVHHFDDQNDAHYYATASVPTGALIDFVGLHSACLNFPGAVGVHLNLVDRFGAATPILDVPCSGHGAFVTDYNATPVGFQLVQNAHNVLVLDVESLNAGNPGLPQTSFRWVEIWWKRAVSPSPATATFTDVPTTHQFFQYIEALKASGITGGCSQDPPQFCPDRPLTRGEMGVFLAKGFGLHWPN